MSSQERIKVIVCKKDRDQLHTKMNICTEFEGPKSVLSVVIIWTKFCLYNIKQKATLTLTFDGLISKSIGIIYTPRQICGPNLANLEQFCLVIIQTRFCLYINMIMVTVTLTSG